VEHQAGAGCGRQREGTADILQPQLAASAGCMLLRAQDMEQLVGTWGYLRHGKFFMFLIFPLLELLELIWSIL